MRKLTQGRKPAKPKPPLEREIQKQIVKYLRLKGWQVWQTSQGYRSAPGGTRMTPGLPDLYCLNEVRQWILWIEVKRPGGKLRPEQAIFRNLHDQMGLVLVAYSLDDVREVIG